VVVLNTVLSAAALARDGVHDLHVYKNCFPHTCCLGVVGLDSIAYVRISFATYSDPSLLIVRRDLSGIQCFNSRISSGDV
jgi:hypothetical protein